MDDDVRTWVVELILSFSLVQARHLMPMFNAKDKLKSGSIKREDIPYMQRGGSWDNTDVRGGKLDKLHENRHLDEYNCRRNAHYSLVTN
jgi:hypothetical protein